MCSDNQLCEILSMGMNKIGLSHGFFLIKHSLSSKSDKDEMDRRVWRSYFILSRSISNDTRSCPLLHYRVR